MQVKELSDYITNQAEDCLLFEHVKIMLTKISTCDNWIVCKMLDFKFDPFNDTLSLRNAIDALALISGRKKSEKAQARELRSALWKEIKRALKVLCYATKLHATKVKDAVKHKQNAECLRDMLMVIYKCSRKAI